jgi:hypothetical protein
LTYNETEGMLYLATSNPKINLPKSAKWKHDYRGCLVNKATMRAISMSGNEGIQDKPVGMVRNGDCFEMH